MKEASTKGELPVLDAHEQPKPLVTYIILGFLQLPDDAAARESYVREHEALIIAEIAAHRRGAGREEEVIRRIADEALARRYRADAERPRMINAYVVGYILRTVIRKHSSIERVIQGPPRIPGNRAALRATWSKWRPVAPLCAAYVDLCAGEFVLDFYRQEGLRPYLARSEWYRLQAECYIPPHGSQPILQPGEAWRAPAALHLDELIAASMPHPAGDKT